jgi:Domain of Unknown Function with PDB structure (DUF3857)/Transglutaminase-like superfamily
LKTILCTFLLSIPYLSIGQKSPIKFGEIPMEDMKMTVYPKDSSAEAVVLADFGESQLKYSQSSGFQLEFERIRRIKILTKEGLDWANFNIPLHRNNSDEEKISGLKAATYNLENGKIVETKAKSESIIKEKYDDNLNFTKVTWPNVKVGSIIEITYKVLSDFVFNFQDWEFQSTIPTVWSEYRVKIPEYFFYEKYMQGYVGLEIAETTKASSSITLTSSERIGSSTVVSQTTFHNDKIDFTENRNRWAAKDVPAFKEEPYMTSSKDFISKINFELSYTKFPNSAIKKYMGTWEDINKSYLESLGDVITGNNFLKRTTEEVTAGKNTPEEKISAIFNYVRKNFLWDGSKRKYPNEQLKKIMEDKKGSSAEINLLLGAMLEKADIKVNPVLVSTRDNGFVRETTPISSQFNYVVCLAKWEDKTILLDATDKFLPIGMLPERCLNGNGFMIAKEGFKWINLTPSTKAKTTMVADLALVEDDDLKGILKIDRTGYHSANARKSFVSKGQSDYVKEFVGSKSWDLSKSEFQNENDLQNPFKEVHELNVNEHLTVAGNTYYLSPFIMGKEESNPFKRETRNYPVDFGAPFDIVYIIKITLPTGFVVEEMPKSKVFALPNNAARYLFNVVQSGNSINITSNMSINKGVFTQEEYPNLREFYSQLVAKQAEQIVLKKN